MKKYSIFLFVVLICFVSACNKKQLQKKPENLISMDKITAIISDILLIEGMINTTPEDSNKVRMLNIYYHDLFKRYNITKEEFQNNIDYYISNEDDAVKVFNEIEIKLKGIEKEYLGDESTEFLKLSITTR